MQPGRMSDDWKESVDRQLGQLHDDVRNLLIGLIGGFLVLAAGGITAYVQLEGKVDGRLTKVEDRLTSIERKVDAMDDGINAKLDALLDRQPSASAK